MFWTVFRFELDYHRRRPSTYLFFATMFLLTFFGIASDAFLIFDNQGQVMKNAPIILAQTMSVMCAIGQTITTALMGTAILRDVQLKSHELLFTTRITRTGYLAGRFAGACLVMLLIYLALPLGSLVGTWMPWVDHDRLQHFRLMSYLRPFLIIVVPNVLFVSALFFAVGAITRNLLAIYVQGVGLFAVWAISQNILRDLDKRVLGAIADPFALSTIGLVTRYWTVADKNMRNLTLSGPLLWNRVLWLGLAAVILGVAFVVVRLEVEATPLLPAWLRRRHAQATPVPAAVPRPAASGFGSISIPAAALHFDTRARVQQLMGLCRFYFVSIVREPVFLAIAIIALVNVSLAAWNVDRQYGTPIWPVTAEMIGVLSGGLLLFTILLTTIYAGELVWRERQLRADGATDTLPVPTSVVAGGKLLGFLGAMGVLTLVAVLATLGVQTFKGYHHYEFPLYLQALVGVVWPTTIELTALALLVHTLVNNKYVGHVVMILFYVLTAVLGTWGFERVLYQYGQPPTFIYSDMNRFGQYAAFMTWVTIYNCAVAAVLLVVAYLFWLRGADDGWPARLKNAAARWRPGATKLAGGLTAASALASGGFVFYNTAVLNPFAGTKEIENRQVAYEKDYRHFKDLAQPRIVGVRIRADLVPERREFALQSVYRVVNKHTRPLDSLLVSLPAVGFGSNISGGVFAEGGYHADSLVWNKPNQVLLADSARGVYLYRLATPLAPGDSLTLSFGGHFTPAGFPNANPNNDIVTNGTFLNNSYFPGLGYDENPELSDDDKRKEHKLGPKARAKPIGDMVARGDGLSLDADWITFDAVVSTAPSQTAIAPGYLQRDTIESGRRVFYYHMDTPILNFYSIQSARYLMRRDVYKGVAIEVYYHPGHDYDVDRMIDAAKRGLDYYTTNFSPYQFRQYRIIEFPRYQVFAESFPNTIPYSEGIGFVARVRDRDDDLDWPLFVTAHELAHQWWAHQIVPANVQGAAMLTESLAEYSALTVMEKRYGASHAQKFLRYELDRYLSGRSGEKKKELPLMLVEGQPYIHYNKGSLAFYALRDYIGEDSLNAALRRYLKDKGFQNPPYTVTTDLLQYLRAVTPDSLQYVIHDLFETITLYDNKADTAIATKRPDGTYAVHLAFSAKKLRADSLGNQTEIPVADYIDAGVFGAPEPGNKLGKPLAVRKVHVTASEMSADFVVSERPIKAGIDPYNKLIDRTPEDNVRTVDVKE